MQLRFLGTGTSTGIPQIGCTCPACVSTDTHDKRLRASAIITADNGARLLIDCGPDFRSQILGAGSPPLDALLVTHSHYDHVGGIDDLRPYCKGGRNFPVYCQADVDRDLRERNPWSFAQHLYPGVPTFAITDIEAGKAIDICGVEVLPLAVMHGKLPILGYRTGPLAYITDCKTMPEETIEALAGTDTLVINALRHDEHPTHLTLAQALELIERIGPRRAYLTHLSHDMGPEASVTLPKGVRIAYDGLTIHID